MAATPRTDDAMARRKQVLQDLVTTIEGADTNVYHEIDGDDLGEVTFDTDIQGNDVELTGTVSSMWTHEVEIDVAEHLGGEITHAVHKLKEAVDALPDSIESKPVPEEAQADQIPQTLEQWLVRLKEYESQIYVRLQDKTGKWTTKSLDQLTPQQWGEHVHGWMTEGTIPVVLREPMDQ